MIMEQEILEEKLKSLFKIYEVKRNEVKKMAEKTWEILEGACYSCRKCKLWKQETML